MGYWASAQAEAEAEAEEGQEQEGFWGHLFLVRWNKCIIIIIEIMYVVNTNKYDGMQ